MVIEVSNVEHNRQPAENIGKYCPHEMRGVQPLDIIGEWESSGKYPAEGSHPMNPCGYSHRFVIKELQDVLNEIQAPDSQRNKHEKVEQNVIWGIECTKL